MENERNIKPVPGAHCAPLRYTTVIANIQTTFSRSPVGCDDLGAPFPTICARITVGANIVRPQQALPSRFIQRFANRIHLSLRGRSMTAPTGYHIADEFTCGAPRSSHPTIWRYMMIIPDKNAITRFIPRSFSILHSQFSITAGKKTRNIRFESF